MVCFSPLSRSWSIALSSLYLTVPIHCFLRAFDDVGVSESIKDVVLLFFGEVPGQRLFFVRVTVVGEDNMRDLSLGA